MTITDNEFKIYNLRFWKVTAKKSDELIFEDEAFPMQMRRRFSKTKALCLRQAQKRQGGAALFFNRARDDADNFTRLY